MLLAAVSCQVAPHALAVRLHHVAPHVLAAQLRARPARAQLAHMASVPSRPASPSRPWPPTRADIADSALSACGVACSLAAISVLDAVTPFRFYGPPYGAITLLLCSARRLPELGAIAATTAIAIGTAQLVALSRLPTWLMRGLTCSLLLLVARLCGARDYPPSGALALLFVEGDDAAVLSLQSFLCPAFSGHAVVVPIAWIVLVLRRRVRAMLGVPDEHED